MNAVIFYVSHITLNSGLAALKPMRVLCKQVLDGKQQQHHYFIIIIILKIDFVILHYYVCHLTVCTVYYIYIYVCLPMVCRGKLAAYIAGTIYIVLLVSCYFWPSGRRRSSFAKLNLEGRTEWYNACKPHWLSALLSVWKLMSHLYILKVNMKHMLGARKREVSVLTGVTFW